jgi:hypothetical protein
MFNANLIKELKLKISLFFGRKNRGSVGIHDSGKGTKMYNNTITGFATGIEEEGENAEAVGNKILK